MIEIGHNAALVISFFIILFGGILLTCARRLNNQDKDAGKGVAGWTIFLLIVWVIFAISVYYFPPFAFKFPW